MTKRSEMASRGSRARYEVEIRAVEALYCVLSDFRCLVVWLDEKGEKWSCGAFEGF